jgi:hypothetical protein
MWRAAEEIKAPTDVALRRAVAIALDEGVRRGVNQAQEAIWNAADELKRKGDRYHDTRCRPWSTIRAHMSLLFRQGQR